MAIGIGTLKRAGGHWDLDHVDNGDDAACPLPGMLAVLATLVIATLAGGRGLCCWR